MIYVCYLIILLKIIKLNILFREIKLIINLITYSHFAYLHITRPYHISETQQNKVMYIAILLNQYKT